MFVSTYFEAEYGDKWMTNIISIKMLNNMLNKVQRNDATIEEINGLVKATFNNDRAWQLYIYTIAQLAIA